ncbi:isoprenyl transferase [Taibaiella chishuiensis]|uniref:Isoprenyl transferase n=1 Tax=Taibaiella chishuiensis TaxID=1434707 RepID=A0A2P8DAI5_9BACT|nr:isoprenyl transferase [Taibaiella chishuiensis]PSK94238.1 undecaprenyl pyrophosphate synthetase [Taibaiella chishuiensis]
MDSKSLIDIAHLPRHVAIIMDGNGRWAKEKGEDRIHGHQQGVISVREVVEGCGEIGVEYLTLYAFSTENWNRPKYEVDALMELLVSTIRREVDDLKKNNVRLHVIGDFASLPEICQKELKEGMEMTASGTGLNLVLALSYSARWEILDAVKKIAAEAAAGKLDVAGMDAKQFEQFLCTAPYPDPELMIRTGGEHRISNFLLYQMAYTELYFTDIHWPDFRKNHLFDAILNYQQRERRFGQTSEQVKPQ